MVTIHITFSIKLTDQKINGIRSSPLFYNWSPTTKDGIRLKTSDDNASIQVWFENTSQHSVPQSWSKYPLTTAEILAER
jgi:hypothetical protein